MASALYQRRGSFHKPLQLTPGKACTLGELPSLMTNRNIACANHAGLSLDVEEELSPPVGKLGPPQVAPSHHCINQDAMVHVLSLEDQHHGAEKTLDSILSAEVGDTRDAGSSSDSTSVDMSEDSDDNEESGPTNPVHGNYDIGAMVGLGSLGTVYKAVRHLDGHVLALKHVHSEDIAKHQAALDEYSIMCNLRHVNIVSIEDFHHGPRDMWLCMEWCEGGSLLMLVKQNGALAEPTVQKLMKQLIGGIEYLHRRRIIHRDIKPDNLLLSSAEEMQLKIGDFNSAKKLGCTGSSTIMLSIRGSPLYFAPEIRFDEDWNERVDVWGIGLCGYFMLRARLPFDMSRSRVVASLEKGVLPPIPWGRSISRKMQNLIWQCLKRDMRHRPSAMELLLHPAVTVPVTTVAEDPCLPEARTSSTRVFGYLSSCGFIDTHVGGLPPRTSQQAQAGREALRISRFAPNEDEVWSQLVKHHYTRTKHELEFEAAQRLRTK